MRNAVAKKRALVATMTMAIATVVIVMSGQLLASGTTPRTGLLVPADPEWHLWPTNAQGQTYGTPTETEKGYHEPDLIKAEATNGTVGYCYRIDLEGPTPRSPEEALRWQAEQGGEDREIPVFKSDGLTQVGVFVIEAATSVTE